MPTDLDCIYKQAQHHADKRKVENHLTRDEYSGSLGLRSYVAEANRCEYSDREVHGVDPGKRLSERGRVGGGRLLSSADGPGDQPSDSDRIGARSSGASWCHRLAGPADHPVRAPWRPRR